MPNIFALPGFHKDMEDSGFPSLLQHESPFENHKLIWKDRKIFMRSPRDSSFTFSILREKCTNKNAVLKHLAIILHFPPIRSAVYRFGTFFSYFENTVVVFHPNLVIAFTYFFSPFTYLWLLNDLCIEISVSASI